MIEQGATYTHGINTVLATKVDGDHITVRRIEEPGDPWSVLGRPYGVDARELHPAAMRYHGNRVPGEVA